MLCSVLALAQALSKRGAFGDVNGFFFLLSSIGLVLDRRWYRALTWHIWRVIWGPLNECSCASVCLSVCKSMEKKLNLYETPIYFRYFGYLLIFYHGMLLGVICISLSILVWMF